MKRNISKLVAVVLTVCMLLSVAPLSVFANTQNVKGTSDVLDFATINGTRNDLETSTIMGEIEGDNLTQGNDDVVIKALTRNLNDASQLKETDEVVERFDLSKPAIIDGVCGGTTEASYNAGFARKLANGDDRSIMCAYDSATNKYSSNTSKQYSVDILVDLGTKYDISGLLISSSYTDVLGDYDIFAGDTQDVFSSTAVANYDFDTVNATQDERNNQGVNTWKVKSGQSLSARYIGIRIYEVNTRPATADGKWYFDRIRINEIAVYGSYYYEPSATVDEDISDNDDISDTVNSNANIVKGMAQANINRAESFIVDNAQGVVSDDYSGITNGSLTDDSVEAKSGTKLTFAFANVTDVTNMLLAFETVGAYNIYASNNRATLFTAPNLKQKYTGTSLAQYLTFNTTQSVKYIGVEFKADAKLKEIAIIGPARTVGDEIYYDADAVNYYESLLKNKLNLMQRGSSVSQIKGEPGTMYIDGMHNGVARKISTIQTYNSENDMVDGDPNTHTDVILVDLDSQSAEFRVRGTRGDNSEWKPNTYVDIITTLEYDAQVESLFFSWSKTWHERPSDYEVFALDADGNVDNLFNSENSLYRIEENTNSNVSQKQVYVYNKPTNVKYVGLRIYRGIQKECNHDYTYPRVAEIAVFGIYNIPRFNHTVTSSMGNILNNSDIDYVDTPITYTAPLTKDGYSFVKWTVDGNDAEGENKKKENKTTLDITLTHDTSVVAVYKETPSTLNGNPFYTDKANGFMAMPVGTFARKVYYSFENYRNNVAIKEDDTDVTDGKRVTTGMKVSALVNNVATETFDVITEGDSTLDGDVNVTDLLKSVSIALDGTTDKKEKFATDVNHDGIITISDIVATRNDILNDDSYEEYTQEFIKIEDIDYKYMGRGYLENPGTDDAAVMLEMASRGIVFNANFMGDLQLEVAAQHTAFKYFTVVIDGVENHEVEIALSKTDTRELLTIAEDVEPGEHTVEIYTQTESGQIRIFGATMFGKTLEKPKDKDLLIEFVGDSITCGMGNLLTSGGSTVGVRHQNSYLSYGSQTARLLNADWCNISHSGSTVVNTNGETTGMPTQYLKISKNVSTLYDFENARKADIVVVNLGTNDNRIIENRADREEYFSQAVEAFARTIIEKNGKDVKIVFAFGMMTNPGMYINTCYERIAAKLKAEGYNVFYCALEKDTSGGDGHPVVAGDTRNAIILSNFIRENVLK